MWIVAAFVYTIPVIALVARSQRLPAFVAVVAAAALVDWLTLPALFPPRADLCGNACDSYVIEDLLLGRSEWLAPVVWAMLGVTVLTKCIILWRRRSG